MQDAGYRDVGRATYAVRNPASAKPSKDFGVIGFGVTPKSTNHTAAAQRYTSGKSLGSNGSGRISSVAPPPPAPPPPPAAPSINQWLAGDTAYKQQTDAAKKAMADYMAQMSGQQGSYETEYQRNLMNTGDAEKLANTDLENDYASRGLTNSGLFLKAKTDLSTDYDKRESTLADGRAEFLANLKAALTNFQSTSNINSTKYKNDAIARRAAKYDV